MQRNSLFKFFIILIVCIVLSNGQSCTPNGNILQCTVTNTSPRPDIDSNNPSGYKSINILYSGNVVLNLTSSSTTPIVINPIDGSNMHTLQVSRINTNANSIQIQISLTSNQVLLPLFTTSCSIIAVTSTLTISVTQIITDASAFKVFPYPSSTTMNFTNYEIIFNTNNANAGDLSLANLIYGLTSLKSITISGNNHLLVVNQAQMPASLNVNQFLLKKLRLNDQILYNIVVQKYSIEQCQYSKTAKFLIQTGSNVTSLEMKNNNPVDSSLPNDDNVFKNLGKLNSLTIIEPKLSSSCLKAIRIANPNDPKILYLELGSYSRSDFNGWPGESPHTSSLTINNIADLSIFSSKFFNLFDALQNLVLQGSFELDKDDLCIFTGITLQGVATPTTVTLNSTKQGTSDWNRCAKTYVDAINIRSMNDAICLPNNTAEDCQRWANETKNCALVTAENNCPVQLVNRTNPYTYKNSYLNSFFEQCLWLSNTTRYPTDPSIEKEGSVNVGAIIGAVCGLIIAMIILGITICCIYRYRQRDVNKNTFSTPQEKYRPSSDDSTHVSIATSKTSNSSRYVLQNSFFPPLQPNDEIAPPLYTAPSEAAASTRHYKLPSAPPAPRDSISTHATHVYESVYS